jgi:exopolyphosphatase/pppGpp-phosphohydrolase
MIRDVLYGVGAALGAYGSLDLAKLGSGEQIGSAIAFGFGGVTFLDQWAQQKKVANKEESVQSLAAAYKDLADRLPKPSPPGDHGS